MKRLLDLAICLVLALPAFLAILLVLPVVALETRATPLFRQRRVGRDGRVFTLLKLRTMRADTPDGASHEVGAATITRSGRVLRRTKVDELPQLWNVLTGDMSLVGPRPCLPSQAELVEARHRLGVDRLRPGITGPAQVAGLDMSDPQRLADADAAYLERWSLRRDLTLLIQTGIGRGSGDAAAIRR
ncbi:sugar transferase [Sphingomonas sanguinis]|uniref:Lipid carrier: UDP-N-acetylgalactosaminyltransferase n=1 Tax=Sphingomonas sanguinis TaxID=33051 RepID=A0A147HWH3_9SPHN|nr:sugar transferase [Sphingomonas sanguinis]KTT69258.1 lipid carrier : UDP-N-acetylgalactosaminyltransferase [Sphingomonas sanguinis]